MEHYYFFILDKKSKELLVFYKNYNFLMVPTDCFVVNIEDIDETEIIKMMLNSNEISDKRKEQFSKILKNEPERFILDKNFPVFAGASDICSIVAETLNNNKKYSKKEYFAKANKLFELLNKEQIDLWGNVSVYERINHHIGTEEFPPVLTKDERVLFGKLLALKFKQDLYETEIKAEFLNNKIDKINFRKMDIFLERNEPRIIEKEEIFKMIIRKLSAIPEISDKFFEHLKFNAKTIYRSKNIKEYCTMRDKYFLGSLFFYKNNNTFNSFLTFLEMVSLNAFKEFTKLKFNVIALNRQETMLLIALCKDIEDYLVVIPKNYLFAFEREILEFLTTIPESFLS